MPRRALSGTASACSSVSGNVCDAELHARDAAEPILRVLPLRGDHFLRRVEHLPRTWETWGHQLARLFQVAPISTNLVLSYVAEHVLGLPRSF
jgi:hypothetical protein